jgi:hypothetical protein
MRQRLIFKLKTWFAGPDWSYMPLLLSFKEKKGNRIEKRGKSKNERGGGKSRGKKRF